MWTRIKNVFTRKEDRSDAVNKKLDEFLSSANRSSAGISITRDTVYGNAAVWAAVNKVAGDVGRCVCHVHKQRADGFRERDIAHPAWKLVHRQATPLIPATTFRETLTQHALLFGNGYAKIVKEGTRPLRLEILDPEQTKPDLVGGLYVYKTRINGVEQVLLPENILHIRGLAFDGLTGHSVIELLREALSTGLALQKFGNVYFRNNGAVSSVIEMPVGAKLDTEDAVERFRKSWGKIHEGIDNAHRVAILEDGATLAKQSLNNSEAQWIDAKLFDLKTVCNVIGIPSSIVNDDKNTSYKSLEQDRLNYLSCLEPWLCRWEEECEIKLLTELEKEGETHSIEFLRESLLKSDSATENEILLSQLKAGAITLDRYCRVKNIPLNDGSIRLMGSDLVAVDAVTFEPLVKPPAPVAPAPGPQDDPQDEPSDERQRLHDLTAATLGRILRRMAKRSESPLASRSLVIESLPGIDEEWVDTWLRSLADEYEAVLPEQRQAVFDGVDVQTLEVRWN